MILTVTANAALDRVIFIDHFEPTTVMRAARMVDSVGGKGLDTSVVLQTLQVPNLAISFMAGPSGQYLAALLDKYQIQHELIWVAGDTRTANVIVETNLHRHSHIMTPGYAVSAADCQRFLDKVSEHVRGVRWVVMAGSLPAGAPADFYGAITRIAHQAGAKALIDCPGSPMLNALDARPDIVKLNRAELAATFGLAAEKIPDLASAARQVLQSRHLPTMVITCGEDGILVVEKEQAYLAKGPRLEAVNAAGAGDAVSASLVQRLSLGESWEQALQWAAAASAAVVLTPGTADCSMEDILRIYPQVSVEQIK